MSSHDIQITFTGLCLFRQHGKDVVVELPDTRDESASHCGKALRVHRARILTTSNDGDSYDDHRLAGMAETFSSDPAGYLAPPHHLASVPGLANKPGLGPVEMSRRAAIITLKGGTFEDKCWRANSCLSGRWKQSPDGQYRWQATWRGTLGEAELTLDLGDGNSVTARRSSDGVIDLVVANLMDSDLDAWRQQKDKHVPHGRHQDDDDFRWFYWMFGWDNCKEQEIPGPSPDIGAKGIPYTCLMGGA